MQSKKTFTLEEAKSLVPWLLEASKDAEARLRKAQLNASGTEESQAKLRAIIYHWAETVSKLGGVPKQPFTVDFDSGDDFFCWEYPEKSIFFRHDYHRGYAGRHRIEEEEP